MKLVSFLRDQEVRLGFLLDDKILEPCLAGISLAPGEERVFRDATSFIRAGEFSFQVGITFDRAAPNKRTAPA